MKLFDLSLSTVVEAVLPVEYDEASGQFSYAGEDYPYWGSLTGRSHTDNYELGKFNRYAKLGNIADEVVSKFTNILKTKPHTIQGRCAYACLLMMLYGVRVGNEDSAEGYESGMEQNKGELIHTYGATTLLNDHISFQGQTMLLNFVGKEQVEHNIRIDDLFLAKYGRAFWRVEAPAEKWLGVDYSTVFDFVKDQVGDNFVPKDFRTFCANTTGWMAIKKFLDKPAHLKKSEAKKEVAEVVETVAKRCNHTPQISKSNYLDRRMLDWFLGQRYEAKDE